MKNYRLFVVSLVTVSCIFLSGFKSSNDINQALAEDKPTITVVKSKKAIKSVKPKTKKAVEDDSLQKTLDLSIPLEGSENADSQLEQQSQLKVPENNLFAPPAKKKTQSLQLEGGWVMSQEPEAEKKKSVDGAGISINLKP